MESSSGLGFGCVVCVLRAWVHHIGYLKYAVYRLFFCMSSIYLDSDYLYIASCERVCLYSVPLYAC